MVDLVRSRRYSSRGANCALLALSLFDFVQTPNDVAQQQFVLEVYLIIQVRAKPIFMRLPILRHHDNRRLQCGEHVERRAKQQKRIWIESSAQKQPTVHEYPESEKS